MTDEKKDTTALTTTAVDMEMITTEAPKPGGDFERITREDMAIPRLALCQKTSPELEPGSPRFIAGIQFTDLFHSADRRLFGKGPVLFTVLRRYEQPRFIEFRPLEQGGGIVDMNVPANDHRTRFTTDAKGNSVKPIATKFLDYIVLVLNGFDAKDPMNNVMALSLKSTGLKAAKELNRLIAWRGPRELFKGVYRVTTGSDTKKNNTYAVYKFDNAGWLKEGTPPYLVSQELWTALKNVDVDIDRDLTPDVDDDSFDPEELERETTTSAPGM